MQVEGKLPVAYTLEEVWKGGNEALICPCTTTYRGKAIYSVIDILLNQVFFVSSMEFQINSEDRLNSLNTAFTE